MIVAQVCVAGKIADSGVEIGVGDGFVAVGAVPPGSEAAAEKLAVGAAPDAEVALVAGRAFVDSAVGSRWPGGGLWGRVGMAASPVRLFAGIGAEPPSTGGVERGVTPDAGDHLPIITLS